VSQVHPNEIYARKKQLLDRAARGVGIGAAVRHTFVTPLLRLHYNRGEIANWKRLNMTNRWFALTVLPAFIVIAAAADRSPAFAELGQPMTFRLIAANDAHGPAIDADGDFVAQTPARFEAFLAANRITPSLPPPLRPTVFFTSGGGSLKAGMELGKIIRRYNLDTSVGGHTAVPEAIRLLLAQKYKIVVNEDCARSSMLQLPNSCRLDRDAGKHASYCVSSCSIAFLGGINRSMVEGSSYAVHQYNFDCSLQPEACDARVAVAAAQSLSADLAAYLEAMAIPAEFLHDMVLADPEHVNVLQNNALLKYKILYADTTATWDVKRTSEGLGLVYEERRRGSNASMVLDCTRRGASAELTLQMVGDHFADRADALAARIIQFQYLPPSVPGNVTWQKFTLLPDEIVRPPYPEQGDGVGLVLRATPRIVDALHKADSVWVTSDVRPGALSVSYAFTRLDKEKVDGYIASCR
jgi:hypothetical protein